MQFDSTTLVAGERLLVFAPPRHWSFVFSEVSATPGFEWPSGVKCSLRVGGSTLMQVDGHVAGVRDAVWRERTGRSRPPWLLALTWTLKCAVPVVPDLRVHIEVPHALADDLDVTFFGGSDVPWPPEWVYANAVHFAAESRRGMQFARLDIPEGRVREVICSTEGVTGVEVITQQDEDRAHDIPALVANAWLPPGWKGKSMGLDLRDWRSTGFADLVGQSKPFVRVGVPERECVVDVVVVYDAALRLA